MSGYSLHTVVSREELDRVLDVCWEAWWDPYIPNIRIAMPIFGYTPDDRQKAIVNSKERFWAQYEKTKPWDKSKYVYAKHDATGETVGALRTDLADGSPFPDGIPQVNIHWWPEGEAKEFCQEMMRQAFTPRSLWMHRPHSDMYNFVVHPKHRGRGVGALLLESHTRELDARGIEGFVQASDLGRLAYRKAGYQTVMKIASYLPDDKVDNPEWKRLYHEVGMIPTYAMWRPKNGKIEPGEPTRPWQ